MVEVAKVFNKKKCKWPLYNQRLFTAMMTDRRLFSDKDYMHLVRESSWGNGWPKIALHLVVFFILALIEGCWNERDGSFVSMRKIVVASTTGQADFWRRQVTGGWNKWPRWRWWPAKAIHASNEGWFLVWSNKGEMIWVGAFDERGAEWIPDWMVGNNRSKQAWVEMR